MFSSELDILSQCFSSNESKSKESEEIIDGIVIKRIENLPAKESSMIKALGYDHEKNIFYAVLKNNKTYCYFDVPLSLWQRFVTTTSSVGRLYNQQIKGKFRLGQVPNLI